MNDEPLLTRLDSLNTRLYDLGIQKRYIMRLSCMGFSLDCMALKFSIITAFVCFGILFCQLHYEMIEEASRNHYANQRQEMKHFWSRWGVVVISILSMGLHISIGNFFYALFLVCPIIYWFTYYVRTPLRPRKPKTEKVPAAITQGSY